MHFILLSCISLMSFPKDSFSSLSLQLRVRMLFRIKQPTPPLCNCACPSLFSGYSTIFCMSLRKGLPRSQSLVLYNCPAPFLGGFLLIVLVVALCGSLCLSSYRKFITVVVCEVMSGGWFEKDWTDELSLQERPHRFNWIKLVIEWVKKGICEEEEQVLVNGWWNRIKSAPRITPIHLFWFYLWLHQWWDLNLVQEWSGDEE